ncbi:4-azaleucine resistance probable transporter AzlC [Lachnospiraceae bacterium G11]|nr:4-azaleucine resistance probable transporter AzlC [Lachnospiraceae bacterium G11]
MNSNAFKAGLKDGVPIGLGYFAVSFSLGIIAKKAGLSAIQGFFASLFGLASAGEYVVFMLMIANASYLEVFIVTLITNARYLLMTTALSQKFDQKTGLGHRIGVGFGITDEVFGITVARPGKVQPAYNYGAMVSCAPAWALGTALGIIAGEILPLRVVSALSVSLYGMFVAIFIPPARKDKFMALMIVLCFATSYLFSYIPSLASISSGTRTIILTVALSSLAAIIKPVKDEEASDAA